MSVLEEKEDQLWRVLQMHSDLSDEGDLASTKADSGKSEEIEEKLKQVSNMIFWLRKEINEARKAAQTNF